MVSRYALSRRTVLKGSMHGLTVALPRLEAMLNGNGTADYPLLIAGGAGGALKNPGTHVNLRGGNATRVPFTILKALGLPDTSWGQGPRYTNQVVSELLT
jgi:hypothetical protein